MSVNDSHKYPCFEKEKTIIREMILADRPVLGICLGAQMIASASGQEVGRVSGQIGWTEVQGRKSRLVRYLSGQIFRLSLAQ